MRRARVLGTLLVLILLGCGAVIFLDQRGAFGTAQASQGTAEPTSPTETTTPTSGDPGYRDLR